MSKRTIPAEKPTEWHGAYDSKGKLRATFDSESEAYHYVRNRGHMHNGTQAPISDNPAESTLASAIHTINTLTAHADKLAEALQHLMAITRNDDALQYREAAQALDAYEAAQD